MEFTAGKSQKAFLVLVVAAIIGLSLFTTQLPAQVTSDVFRRVLMIQAGRSQGSGFTIDIDGRQYLITAKHLVVGLKGEDSIQIRRGDEWSSVKVKVFRCDDPIDIAVLVPPAQLTVTFPLEATTDKVLFGQEAYFVGFPYGISMDGKNSNTLYPIAFPKKGIISGMVPDGNATLIFLDGHNNVGFSGGPIVYRDLNQKQTVFYLAGVVSGYRSETTPVLKPTEIKTEEVKPEDIAADRLMEKDGHLFRLTETGDVVKLNTGIVRGYHIKHAVELIRKNPIGPKVAE